MTIQQNAEEHKGGPAWDARDAMRMIFDARAKGDTEAEATGWLRYAEALINAAYSGASAAFLGILNARDDTVLRRLSDIDTAVQGLRQDVDARLDTLDTRHAQQWQAVIQELGQVRAWVREGREHRQQLATRLDDVEKRLSAVEASVHRAGLA